MKKKTVFLIIIALVWLYPAYALFALEQAMGLESQQYQVRVSLRDYQVSIWISWVVMAILSVYYKWTQKSNFFFSVTYGFLLLAFVLFGYYTQRMVSVFDLPSTFDDDHTLGIFAAVQNIFVAAILTGFLQAGVWWFTRRWHRRY